MLKISTQSIVVMEHGLNFDYEPTRVQEDTLKLLLKGYTHKAIAIERGISWSSVQETVTRLYKNTNAGCLALLVIWAVKKGYVNV